MKNLLIFGANGHVGTEILKQALERDYLIRAFVRSPDKLNIKHPHLKIFHGDALDIEAVKEAMKGQELIVSALSGTSIEQRIKTITHIISAMQQEKVKRIIALGGAGILQHTETSKLYETEQFSLDYLHFTLGHLGVWEHLKRSHLDYTLVCPPNIPGAEKTKKYQYKANFLPAGWQIGNGDLADFILNELERNEFIKLRVGIAN